MSSRFRTSIGYLKKGSSVSIRIRRKRGGRSAVINPDKTTETKGGMG